MKYKQLYMPPTYTVCMPRGPQLWIFVNVILESLDSWLDSEIPKLIYVIPIYQIRTCASHDLQYTEKY